MLGYLLSISDIPEVRHLVHEQVDSCILNKKPFHLGEKRLEGLVSRDLNIYPNELQDSLADELSHFGVENPDETIRDYFKSAV